IFLCKIPRALCYG
nr:immunoglobulin heavy chain junction region [Mus musculus]